MLTAVSNTFWQTLHKSNLLTARQFSQVKEAALKANLEDNPHGLAQALIKKELLTRWQAEQLLKGQQAFFLGKYKLIDRLGSGGMGSVLKAIDTKLGYVVALKVLSSQQLESPTGQARFQREIQAAAVLNHPHIIRSIDADCVGKTHFLVMEYVQGTDLHRWLKKQGPLPIRLACELIRQTALGLEYAHQSGMVHRDIKPANIMVTQDERGNPLVKLLDMGLARFVSEEHQDDELTQTGQILGTPDYISPEQAKNTRTADIRSDIFSLGCTLFRIITGKVPFEGKNPVEKLVARYTNDAPNVRSLRPEISPELEQVIAKMLARDPAARYQTPQEVADVLIPFATHSNFAAQSNATPDTFANVNTNSNSSANPSAYLMPPIDDDDVSQELEIVEDGNQTHDFLNLLSDRIGSDSTDGAQAPSETLTSLTSGVIAVDQKLPDNSSITLSIQRKQRQRYINVGIIAACAMLFLIFGAYALYSSRETQLVIDWPAKNRTNATLMVDGELIPLDEKTQPVTFRNPPGEHTVLIQRSGYEDYEWNGELGWGEKQVVKPRFILTLEEKRKRQIADLVEETSKFLQLKPEPNHRTFVASLRKKLHYFHLNWQQTKEGKQAQNLLSQLDRHFASITPPVTRPISPRPTPNPRPIHPRPTPIPTPIPTPESGPLDQLQVNQLQGPAKYFAKHTPGLVGVIGNLNFQHPNVISSLAFSADGTTIASSSWDGLVLLWDVKTGELLHTFTGADNLYQMDFSPDGQWIATLSYPSVRTVRSFVLIHVPTQKIHQLELGELKNPLCFGFSINNSGDSELLTGHESGKIAFWDLSSFKTVRTIQAHSTNTRAVAVHSSTQKLASFGNDGLKLWDLQSEMPKPLADLEKVVTASISQQRVGAIAMWTLEFSADGSTLASLGPDKNIKFWDVEEQQPLYQIQLESALGLQQFRFSPQGNTIALSGRGNVPIKLWDVRQQKEVQSIQLGTSYNTALTFQPTNEKNNGFKKNETTTTPKSQLLAVASGSQILFVDAVSGKRIDASHSSELLSLGIQQKSELVLSLSEDKLRIWNPSNQQTTEHTLPTKDILRSGISYDGKRIAIYDATKRFYWAELNSLSEQLKWTQSNFPLSSTGKPLFALHPSKNVIAMITASGKPNQERMVLLELASNKVLKAIDLPVGAKTHTLEYHPSGSHLAYTTQTAPSQTQVWLWEISSNQPQLQLPLNNTIVELQFHPTQPQLLTVSDQGFLHLWDYQTRKQVWKTPVRLGANQISSAAFRPQGDLLVILTTRSGVQYFDTKTGKLVGRLASQALMTYSQTIPTSSSTTSSEVDSNANQLIRFSNSGRQLIVPGPNETLWIIRPTFPKL